MSSPRLNRKMSGALLCTGLIMGLSAGAVVSPSAWADKPSNPTSIGLEVYKMLYTKSRSNEGQQKRARTNTSVMGVRGLDDDADAESKSRATANMRAVYEMEDRTPNEKIEQQLRNHLRTTSENKPTRIENISPTLSDLEAEIDLGRKMAAQILGANKLVNNPVILDYLSALVSTLSAEGLKTNRPFRLAVLDSQRINAFACPGGYIFITRGALMSARDEDQLAAMLGHEIAHISQRHLIASLQKRFSQSKESKSRTKENAHVVARQRVRPEPSQHKDDWSRLLGPKSIGVSLLQASSEALDTLLTKGLDREFELEADRLGQHISTTTGYDARGLMSLFSQLKSSTAATTNSKNQTHPPYELRIENLSNYVQNMLAQFNRSPGSSPLFLAMQRELEKR